MHGKQTMNFNSKPNLLGGFRSNNLKDSVDQKLIYEKKLKDRTTKMKNHFEYEVRQVKIHAE